MSIMTSQMCIPNETLQDDASIIGPQKWNYVTLQAPGPVRILVSFRFYVECSSFVNTKMLAIIWAFPDNLHKLASWRSPQSQW